MKFTEEIATKASDQKAIHIGNISGNYTYLQLNDEYSLFVSIPANNFGMMMIYGAYEDESSESGSGAFIRAISSGESGEEPGLGLRDYNKGEQYEWIYPIKKGINNIQIAPGSYELRISGEVSANSYLVMSNLSVVEGINDEFLGLDDAADENALLAKLAVYKDFYYSNPIDGSSAIDVDKMSDVNAMYDYNNILNKFIISEIDADKIKEGVKLTRSSRK